MTQTHATRSPWVVFATTALGVLLSAVNVSAISVALPSVVRHFGATAAQASWILIAYLLANTVMILIFGRLADHLGRERLYRFGLITLTGSSLLCGFAPSAGALIALQLIQGIGAAAIISNVVALLADYFPVSKLGLAIGWNTALVSVAQVIGPLLGGVLTAMFDWRAVFWFNVPVGVAGIALAHVTLRRGAGAGHQSDASFDLFASVSYAVAMTGLCFAFINAGAGHWASPWTLGGLVCAVILFPVFFASQLREKASFLERSLFRGSRRNAAYFATFCVATARTAVVVLVAVYVQAARGGDAMEAGLSVFPLALGMAVASGASGWLGRVLSLNRAAAAGASVSSAGLALLGLLISPEVSSHAITGCLVLVGLGIGMFMGPNTTLILANTAASQRGVVNGLRSMFQNFAYLASSALVLAYMAHGLGGVQRDAVYAGKPTGLGSGLSLLTQNCQYALWALACIALIGAVASWRDSSSPATVDRRQRVLGAGTALGDQE